MSEITFSVLQIVIIIISLVIARFVIPYLKDQIDSKQLEQVRSLVYDAVLAVEQVIGNGKGKEKKEEVLNFIMDIVKVKNWSITRKQVDILIESAVFIMNGGKK